MVTNKRTFQWLLVKVLPNGGIGSLKDKMKIRIRIQGFLVFLAIITSILLSKFLFPQWKKEILDEFLDAVGIGIIFFGFLFRIVARGYKSETSPDGRRLITDGLYGLIRHPMYFGTLLIGSGIILTLFKWWVFPLFLLIFLLIYTPQTNQEEKRLSRHFGDEYRTYCKRTPKYFPNIYNLFKIDLRDYLSFKWIWIKKEISSLTGVIGIIIAVETWEDVRQFGYSEYTKELLEFSLVITIFVIIFILFYKKEELL